MDADEIMRRLQTLGTSQCKRILMNNGANEPLFGVKIEELKKIQKQVKANYQLALELFATGNYDAQYLAGLIADETKMTKRDLKRWLATANCVTVCGSAVAAIAAESRHGWDLALEWIEAKNENTATVGWTTLSGVVAITADSDLDLPQLKKLIQRVGRSIHDAPNHVRYAMNGFLIAVGCYVAPLTELALKTGAKIGVVSVDMGNTACKVPFAPDYIRKVQQRGTIGKKRKAARC